MMSFRKKRTIEEQLVSIREMKKKNYSLIENKLIKERLDIVLKILKTIVFLQNEQIFQQILTKTVFFY